MGSGKRMVRHLSPLSHASKGGEIMRSIKNVNGLVILVLALVLVWAGVAAAGVPAPPPEGAGPHPPHQIANLGHFQFENGEVVKDFKVSYVTHGKLSPQKDNVILVMHYFAADHHGFDFLIGPGKALDTDKYYIVATDMLGNSRPSQDLTTGPTNSGLKMEFPRYTMHDSVNVEYKLLKEYLGFDHILAAAGISFGAMKAYQFAVSYPAYVSGIIPIMGSPMTSPQMRLVLESWTKIIEIDNGWYSGNYDTNPTMGLNIVFQNISLWVRTYGWFATNVKTEEDYQRMRRSYTWWMPQDARDIYYQLQAWADFNVGDTPGFKGDAKAALQSVKAQALIIGAKGDLLFNREELIFAKEAIPKATHVEIDSPYGHMSCCGYRDREATKIMDREIANFLAKLQ
jgi:homoserine O-acetyltransferase